MVIITLYWLFLLKLILVFLACAAYCTECKSKGAGKCDAGKCVIGFAIDINSDTCQSGFYLYFTHSSLFHKLLRY